MSAAYPQTFGDAGPRLVMVPGWAMHSGIWRGFALRLAGQLQVTCLDLPGHGRAPKISPLTVDTAARSLAAAGPDGAAWWLGWSLGGSVVLALAERHPERVRGLVLLAANPKFTQADDWPGIRPSLLRQFADDLTADAQATLSRFLSLQVNGLADGKALRAQLLAAVGECAPPDSQTLLAGLRMLSQADLRPAVAALKVPVLMVAGSHDTLVPPAVLARTAALSARVSAHLLERAGHAPFLSHGQALAALVGGFVNAHRDGR